MLHVVRAGGLEVEEDRDLAGEPVEGGEGEGDVGSVGYGGEMDEGVGGSAYRLKDDHGVADGGRGEDVGWAWGVD